MKAFKTTKTDCCAVNWYKLEPTKYCLKLGWSSRVKKVLHYYQDDRTYETTTFYYSDDGLTIGYIYNEKFKQL